MATTKFRPKLHLSIFLVTICAGITFGYVKNTNDKHPVVLVLDKNLNTKDLDLSGRLSLDEKDLLYSFLYNNGLHSHQSKKFRPGYDQYYLNEDRYDRDRRTKQYQRQDRHGNNRNRYYGRETLNKYRLNREDRDRRQRYQADRARDVDRNSNTRSRNDDDSLERYRNDQERRDRNRYDRNDRRDQDRRDRQDQDRGDQQDQNRYDRDDQDRRDRQDQDRLDDDRRDREDRDRRQDQLEKSRLRHGLRLGLQHRPNDPSQGEESPVIKSLLRISNVLRCGAKDKCEEECRHGNRYLRQKEDCESKCDKLYECEDDYDDKQNCDEDSPNHYQNDHCGQHSISTKGERYYD